MNCTLPKSRAVPPPGCPFTLVTIAPPALRVHPNPTQEASSFTLIPEVAL
ncbi:hypothetical protein [Aquimarina aquimarini]|nr:hypothetical protein [Aquimarina aquimarini]